MLTTLGSGGHGTRDSFDLSDRRARGPGIWVGSAGATRNQPETMVFRDVFVDVLWLFSVGTWMNLVWWASGLLALTNENWIGCNSENGEYIEYIAKKGPILPWLVMIFWGHKFCSWKQTGKGSFDLLVHPSVYRSESLNAVHVLIDQGRPDALIFHGYTFCRRIYQRPLLCCIPVHLKPWKSCDSMDCRCRISWYYEIGENNMINMAHLRPWLFPWNRQKRATKSRSWLIPQFDPWLLGFPAAEGCAGTLVAQWEYQRDPHDCLCRVSLSHLLFHFFYAEVQSLGMTFSLAKWIHAMVSVSKMTFLDSGEIPHFRTSLRTRMVNQQGQMMFFFKKQYISTFFQHVSMFQHFFQQISDRGSKRHHPVDRLCDVHAVHQGALGSVALLWRWRWCMVHGHGDMGPKAWFQQHIN